MASVLAAIRDVARADRIRAALGDGEISRRTLIVAYVAIIVTSCLLRTSSPMYVIGMAIHDDFLFVKLARHLVDRQWLGLYDNLTLVKGMGYPAFIALAFALGIPLKLAEHAVYLGAASIMTWVIYRLTGNKLLSLLLFGFLAFSPELWGIGLARVLRDSLYIGFSLLIVAIAAAILLVRWRRIGWSAGRVALLLVLGLLCGWYWVTREEAVWIVPTFVVLVVGAGVQMLWLRGAGESRPPAGRILVRATVAGLLVLVPFGAVLGGVATMNYYRYGLFATDEMRADSFRSGLGALMRIQHEPWRRFVLVPKGALEKAYSVSEAARELRPYFEGAIGDGWTRESCHGFRARDCSEIMGIWIIYAFRDAVEAAGHYTSARAAAAYYKRLAAEIDAACNDGRLSCRSDRRSVMPPFRSHYITDALVVVPAAIRVLMRSGFNPARVPASVDPRARIDFFADMAGAVQRRRTQIIFVRGVAVGGALPPQVVVHDRNGAPFNLQFDTVPTSSHSTPAGRTTVFEMTTDCLNPRCDLLVRSGADEWSAPIATLASGGRHVVGKLEVTIEMVSAGRGSLGGSIMSPLLRLVHQGITTAIGATYLVLTPLLTALAVVGLVMALIWRRHHRLAFGLWIVVAACIVAFVSRVALVSYFQVTSVPLINNVYLAPAFPFFQIFIVLGTYMGAVAWIGWRSAAGRPERA